MFTIKKLNETLIDKNVLKGKFKTYKKSPYIYNDVIDLYLTLILYIVLGFITLKLQPKIR